MALKSKLYLFSIFFYYQIPPRNTLQPPLVITLNGMSEMICKIYNFFSLFLSKFRGRPKIPFKSVRNLKKIRPEKCLRKNFKAITAWKGSNERLTEFQYDNVYPFWTFHKGSSITLFGKRANRPPPTNTKRATREMVSAFN